MGLTWSVAGNWQNQDRRNCRRALPSWTRFPMKNYVCATGAQTCLYSPSVFEEFGPVILEAIASGLPVISTDATASPGVDEYFCRLIVPPGDVEALAQSLGSFSIHRDQLPEM